MPTSTRALKEDVLFRAGEPTSGSQWATATLQYLNRAYKTLANGSSEFLPEFVDDWWWMRDSGALLLEPVRSTGTVEVTNGSADIAFDPAPSTSLEGWRFKVADHPDLFVIESHMAGVGDAVLDTEYTGPTNSASAYRAMRTMYELSTDVAALISPIVSYRENAQIIGVTPERLDQLFPLPRLGPGVPVAFSLEDNRRVRFSHGGRQDGVSMRVEYRYRPVVEELIDATDNFPLVPEQYRHVLADMALAFVLQDKNDSRTDSTVSVARAGAAVMFRENRRRMAKIDPTVGMIWPRLGHRPQHRRPIRTDSGLIIG